MPVPPSVSPHVPPDSGPTTVAPVGRSAGESSPVQEEKRVSTVELFFDLIFVYAVTRTSELLQEHHAWLGVAMASAAFVPVFWLWVGATMFANLTDADTVRSRFVFFGLALSGLAMALALPEAYGHRGLIFALTYWWGRLVLLVAVRGHRHRREFVTFPVGAFLTGPVLVAGALLPASVRVCVWLGAGVIDLVTPLLLRRRVQNTPFEVGHLADRYGTFVIIALGEAVVATGAAAAGLPDQAFALASAALGLAVGWGLWWTYFDLAAPVIARGLSTASVAIEVIRPVLSYGHLLFVSGIIAVAAGIGDAVGAPTHPLTSFSAALLLGGAAVFLATFGFTRWQLVHTVAVPRLSGAALLLALLPAAPHVPALAVLVALVLLLLAVNVADHWRAARTSRQPTVITPSLSPTARS